MDKANKITEYFAEVETTKEHEGYYYSVGEALTIVILGSICGLKNVSQIHQWAENERITEFLSKYFGIRSIPCYYWMLCLLKIIEPASLNRCFTKWAETFLSNGVKDLTLSFDGKTIRSTDRMDKYTSPLHIISAQIAELGITLGQNAVNDKSNEIPAVRDLIRLLNIEDCVVVADALNCQTETAKAIINGKADYLLNVKDNQPTLKKDIEDYVQDADLRKTMDTHEALEKNGGRIERRTAFSTVDIEWLYGGKDWDSLACIGAVLTRVATCKGTASDEWHYYISSRTLSAEELLRRARLEWSVEAMHWLLDVHFNEDYCRVEDKSVQQNLNVIRKIALNSVKGYKDKNSIKRPFSRIMLDALLDPMYLLSILNVTAN